MPRRFLSADTSNGVRRGHPWRNRRMGTLFLALHAFVLWPLEAGAADSSFNTVQGRFQVLNDNGAWSWFMDERAIADRGRLIVGSVRANGRFDQPERPGWGNVELTVLDIETGGARRVILHEHFEQDDHNAPGLLVLGDGRYLAAYTKHNQEPRVYYRISTNVGDPFEWEPVRTIETPTLRAGAGPHNATYCNLFRIPSENGRIYLFHRGFDMDPNYLWSDDDGRSWRYGGRLFAGRDGYSPYAKYAFNGLDSLHVVATEDHPRNFDNSLYHGFMRGGGVHASDGSPLGALSSSTNTSLKAWDLTRIYQGGPSNVAWMCDMHLDGQSRPVVLFTTQRDGAGLPMGAGGLDHRFHDARWDGERWNVHEIAFAGTRLYPGEDDYTGLGSIDPNNTSVIYISTDADPVTGKPLISRGNFRRHHELFQGTTADGGRTWRWVALTSNSTMDNLRPIVPIWKDSKGRTLVIWMRGGYRVNRGEWSTEVVATFL